MKTIEELKKQIEDDKEEIEMLQIQKEEIEDKIYRKEGRISRAKNIITDYEEEVELEKQRNYKLKIIKWIMGSRREFIANTYLVDNKYEGIVCPRFNVVATNLHPYGTSEEIISLLKEGNYILMTYSSERSHNGYSIKINLYKEL